MAFHNFTTEPDDLPLYKHISFLLSEEIRQKHKPGDTLASEQELAKRYKVHRHTLRRALEELVNEGIIGKLQGRGTIVKQKLINYAIHSDTRFTDTLEKSGRKAETVVLRKRGIPAQGDLVEILKLQNNEPVACIETLRKMDDLPFSMVTHYIPLEKAYDLIRLYKGGSLHRFLLEHYTIKVKRIKSMIQAALPEKEDIKTLSITGNSPILLVKSINVDQQTEEPMELAVSRFRGISTQLVVEPK